MEPGWSVPHQIRGARTYRARICKYLRSPGIKSEELKTPAYVVAPARQAGNRFLGSLLHCKKELAIFPSPAGMSLTKLSLGGKKLNYSRPGRVWSVTSRLGMGKRLTLFYSVCLQKRAQYSTAELLASGRLRHGLINEIDIKSKYCHKKYWPVKGLCGSVYKSL
jgi:hypothetical protein